MSRIAVYIEDVELKKEFQEFMFGLGFKWMINDSVPKYLTKDYYLIEVTNKRLHWNTKNQVDMKDRLGDLYNNRVYKLDEITK